MVAVYVTVWMVRRLCFRWKVVVTVIGRVPMLVDPVVVVVVPLGSLAIQGCLS